MICLCPFGARQEIVNKLPSTRECEKALRFLKSNFDPGERLFIISDLPGIYLIHGHSAEDFSFANRSRNYILDKVHKEYEHILIFQRYTYTISEPWAGCRLTVDLNPRELHRIKVSQGVYIKISEVAGLQSAVSSRQSAASSRQSAVGIVRSRQSAVRRDWRLETEDCRLPTGLRFKTHMKNSDP